MGVGEREGAGEEGLCSSGVVFHVCGSESGWQGILAREMLSGLPVPVGRPRYRSSWPASACPRKRNRNSPSDL